ncbi:MAG: aquaporin [Nitrososphaerales archaeon]|nr:aquaporin [Nitrososphaerales archaeon]
MSSNPGLAKKLAAELLGTFVFVLVGAGSAVGVQSLGATDPSSALLVAALANGLGLAMAVTATMAVSGGSLNPAVTIALLAVRKISATEAVPYILAELAGATLAGLALVVSLPSSVGGLVHWGAPSLANSLTITQGTLLELLMTFVLMFAILGTAVDPRAPKIGGLGIGLAVLADVLLGGPLTGAAMNPARAMGPMIAGGFLPSYWYIYWLGPVAGAILAAFAYRYCLEKKG